MFNPDRTEPTLNPTPAITALLTLATSVVATTFELLPDRVDLFSFVLQSAGLFAILGTVAGLAERRARRPDRRGLPPKPYAEYGTTVGAAGGLLLFSILLLIQEVLTPCHTCSRPS